LRGVAGDAREEGVGVALAVAEEHAGLGRSLPRVVADMAAFADSDGERRLQEFCGREGIRSVCIAPIVADRDFVGLLLLGSRRAGAHAGDLPLSASTPTPGSARHSNSSRTLLLASPGAGAPVLRSLTARTSSCTSAMWPALGAILMLTSKRSRQRRWKRRREHATLWSVLRKSGRALPSWPRL
jgi:hypothetical protein